MRILLTALLLTLAVPALAGDAGTAAAALPDEASECRYFMQFCSEEAAAMAQHHADVQAATNARSLTDAQVALHLAHMSDVETDRRATDRMDVERVIRAKHGCSPTCFRECQQLDMAKLEPFCPETRPSPTPERPAPRKAKRK